MKVLYNVPDFLNRCSHRGDKSSSTVSRLFDNTGATLLAFEMIQNSRAARISNDFDGLGAGNARFLLPRLTAPFKVQEPLSASSKPPSLHVFDQSVKAVRSSTLWRF